MFGIDDAILGGASLLGGLFSGLSKNSAANRQMRRANRLRQEAETVTAQPLNKEFGENKAISQNKVSGGLPAMGLYKNRIESGLASSLDRAKMTTDNAGQLLASIGASELAANRQLQDLDMKDAAYRDTALNQVKSDNMAIAQEKARLDAIKRAQQADIRKQANALETAATANKQTAMDDISGGVTRAALLGTMGLGDKNNSQKAKNPNIKFNTSTDVGTTDISDLGIEIPKTKDLSALVENPSEQQLNFTDEDIANIYKKNPFVFKKSKRK